MAGTQMPQNEGLRLGSNHVQPNRRLMAVRQQHESEDIVFATKCRDTSTYFSNRFNGK